eukprot:2586513-Prymnesium_polylepis.1
MKARFAFDMSCPPARWALEARAHGRGRESRASTTRAMRPTPLGRHLGRRQVARVHSMRRGGGTVR